MTRYADTVKVFADADSAYVVWQTPRSTAARTFATIADADAYAAKARARLAKRYDAPETFVAAPKRVVAPVAPIAPIIGSPEHIARIEAEARKLMTELLPADQGWSFYWDGRSHRRAGVCWYGDRRIGLSKKLMNAWTFEAARNTILHEIAHAICGHAAGHGAVWAAKCRELGGDGKQYWSVGEGRVHVPAPRRRPTYRTVWA